LGITPPVVHSILEDDRDPGESERGQQKDARPSDDAVDELIILDQALSRLGNSVRAKARWGSAFSSAV